MQHFDLHTEIPATHVRPLSKILDIEQTQVLFPVGELHGQSSDGGHQMMS